MNTTKHILSTLIFSLLLAANANANDCGSCNVSRGSTDLSAASGFIVIGSMSAIAASGQIIVNSIEYVGDGAVVVLTASATGVSTTVKLSANAVKQAGLASDAVVSVSVVSTGYLLVASGKALAFIPNEIGQALLHSDKVSQ